jgi:hypothetical protein
MPPTGEHGRLSEAYVKKVDLSKFDYIPVTMAAQRCHPLASRQNYSVHQLTGWRITGH